MDTQDSDTQRLRDINRQLLKLYVQSDQESLTVDQEREIQLKIQSLEAELGQLVPPLIQDEKLSQYIMILENTARTVQLYRQSLYDLPNKSTSQLSPDEIRQKNIMLNKFQSSEKKMRAYRQKLSVMGLQSFELDDIILRGYREQNQSVLQSLLRNLEQAIKVYLLEYYDKYGQLPDDMLTILSSWFYSESRSSLTYTQLKVSDSYQICLQKGIPVDDIEQTIQTVVFWDKSVKSQQLTILESKLKTEVDDSQDRSQQVELWIQEYAAQQDLSPQQVEIVILVKELLMHGIQQTELDRVLKKPLSETRNDFLSLLKKRFRGT